MDKKRYDIIKENRKANNSCSYSVYPNYLRLIRGLRESCLYRLIKSEDVLLLRIVPAKRE